MSNIQDNSQPKRPSPDAVSRGLKVEVQSHLGDLLPDGFAEMLSKAVTVTSEWAGILRGEIEIAVVDDERIHGLNRRHLDHDWETDVISFPYEREQDYVSGELIISWETACRESKVTGWPAMTELVLYAIHGTLHLVGMDDQDDSQRNAMRSAERCVLELLRPEGFERYDVSTQGVRE